MSAADFDDDHEFDVGRAGSSGPDIYGDNLDFNIEDNLPDFLPSPTSSTSPTTSGLSHNAYSSQAALPQLTYGSSYPEQQRDQHHHLQHQQQPHSLLQGHVGSTAPDSSRGVTYHMVHALPPKPEIVMKAESVEHVVAAPVAEAPARSIPRETKREDAGKIFVGGLNWETSDESMRAHFSKWGEVLDCSVMKEPGTLKSRGFGFLTYADPDVVPTMLAAEHILDGKRVDPKRAIPREEQVLTEKIFVGGISPEVSEEDLTAFFNQFGKVIDTTLMIDRDTGRPRGFGFVTFESDVMVEELVARRDLAIKGKIVEVRRAMPKHKALQAKQAREMANAAFGGSSMIPTFVSDSRNSAMGKLSVPGSIQGRPAYTTNPAAAAAAAAAMYGGAAGAMGMSGAAKNWMAQMYGAANAAAGSPAASAASAGAFYGFPAAAAYQGMYNPAALMAYYQRMAASGFNWQAAAAAAAAGRSGGWFPGAAATSAAGSTGATVGGYDMYAGGGSSAAGGAGGPGGYGNMAAMMMAASRGMAAGGGVGSAGVTGGSSSTGRSLERESNNRDPRRRSSRSRSPQRWDSGGRGRSDSDSRY